ncbi:hypothetical protein [Alkalihalobacterium alkalinitrilicum]|nr:hypothetical protein [Alkalihalobacterium alkalinitrilicum]
MPWSDLPCIEALEGEVVTLQLKKRNDTKIYALKLDKHKALTFF